MRELTDLEFDILWILADNKGHALWELVKLLGKEKSNLIIVLSRLEEEIELTDLSKIDYYDTANMTSLGLEINKANDPLSKYIKERLEPNTVRLMNSNPENFCFSGYSELDRLLDDPDLYDERRFAKVVLSERTLEIINSKPTGRDLRCLNRKLLEEAYPEFILKGKDSIIFRGLSRKTTNPNSRQPKHHEIPYLINPNILVLNYILTNLRLIDSRSFRKRLQKQKIDLADLKEKQEWQLIDDEKYLRLKKEIVNNFYGSDEEWDEDLKISLRIENLVASQYALEFVRCFGFKLIIHRLHGIVGGWDTCWRIADNAIKSGVIKEEDDLDCAKKLIRYHQDVEEGFKQLEQESKEIRDDYIDDIL